MHAGSVWPLPALTLPSSLGSEQRVTNGQRVPSPPTAVTQEQADLLELPWGAGHKGRGRGQAGQEEPALASWQIPVACSGGQDRGREMWPSQARAGFPWHACLRCGGTGGASWALSQGTWCWFVVGWGGPPARGPLPLGKPPEGLCLPSPAVWTSSMLSSTTTRTGTSTG